MKQEEFENEKAQLDELIEKDQVEKTSEEIEDNYKFGWSIYSEITNGRFAMLGFIAIIFIELLSQQSFLQWAGIQ
tara:strand:+ start:9223 stop:9447 length:225 start_codon:yes stop_codon:yes gene_type:complete